MEGENLITFLGESFLMNRCINDDYKPMKYIVMGNGESVPLKTDKQLGNELSRKLASRKANLTEKAVDLKASFTASEVMGSTEIGVANDEILISHDVFEEIDSDTLINPIGEVEVTYSFQFSTATIRIGWVNDGKGVYHIYEPSNIIMVYENTTKNGYRRVASEEECRSVEYSYFYNALKQVLYIHTGNNQSVDTLELIIQSK